MILGMTVPEFVGQAFGLVAVVISFVAYQMPTQKKILIMNLLVSVAITLNYALIGATTGMILNLVCIVRNLIFINRDKKIFSYRFYPYLMMAIIGGMSLFFGREEGAHSILIAIGLMVNTLALSLTKPQSTRYCMAVSCSFIFAYNVFVFSIGGMINEAVAIVSSILGIIRYRKAGTEGS